MALLCPAEELFQTIAENECVADLTSSHDELEKLMLVNGTEPRCGVINHYAEEAWPFSGYLHSLKLWDEYIPKK